MSTPEPEPRPEPGEPTGADGADPTGQADAVAGPGPDGGSAPSGVVRGDAGSAHRRAPRFGPFILTGALLGAVLALLVSVVLPDPAGYSERTVAGYLVAIGLLLGGVIGAGLAVLADRRG